MTFRNAPYFVAAGILVCVVFWIGRWMEVR